MKVIIMVEQKERFKLTKTKFLLSVLMVKHLSPPAGLERRGLPSKEVWPPCLKFELKTQLAQLLSGWIQNSFPGWVEDPLGRACWSGRGSARALGESLISLCDTHPWSRETYFKRPIKWTAAQKSSDSQEPSGKSFMPHHIFIVSFISFLIKNLHLWFLGECDESFQVLFSSGFHPPVLRGGFRLGERPVLVPAPCCSPLLALSSACASETAVASSFELLLRLPEFFWIHLAEAIYVSLIIRY